MERRDKMLYMIVISGGLLLLLYLIDPNLIDMIGNYLTILVLVMLLAPVIHNKSKKN